MSAAGLILAAGESRRMGRPKALLEYRGATFLESLVGLFSRWCSPVVVVLGASAGEIRAAADGAACFVVNARYRDGQTSSMQCGLRAVPQDTEGVLFTLVDHPAVEAETVEALLGVGGRGACPAALLRVPRYRGRRGHPIWFSPELIPEFLALPPAGAARDVVRAHEAETQFIDLDDPGIVTDIDDPDAYRALLEGAREN